MCITVIIIGCVTVSIAPFSLGALGFHPIPDLSLPAPDSSCAGEKDGESAAEAKARSEADREHAWAKQLKAITWPDMDDDALASSYVTKVLTCLGKWQVRMSDLMDVMGNYDDEVMNKFLVLIFYSHFETKQ